MRAAGRARTLFTSPRWIEVLGVDVAETALAIAREKAAERRIANRQINDHGIEVEFAAADAFQLERLGAGLRRFWTADCSMPSTATSEHNTWRA